MKIEIIKTEISYCVPLTIEQWNSLEKTQKTIGVRGEYQAPVHEVAYGYETPDIKKLMVEGCYDLEWNGHFGRNFYFKCRYEDSKRATQAVTKFIKSLTKK